MSARYRLKKSMEFRAWRNLLNASQPAWIARKWHSLEDSGTLESVACGSCQRGSWIIEISEDEPHFVVMTDDMFNEEFEQST